MGHIDELIARIPHMPRRERMGWRAKAEGLLKGTPGHVDAARVVAALDASEPEFAEREAAESNQRPPDARLEITGHLAWEKFQHGKKEFRAFQGSLVVGYITMRANHSDAIKQVYNVRILDDDLPGTFQHIEDARLAGEVEIRKRSGEPAA
jgi:hypothetical protein